MGFSLGGILGTVGGVLNPVALAGTALATGGDIFSAISQKQAVDSTNATNQAIAASANLNSAQQAAAQMAFQKQMSDTQYQRGVHDMTAAGLNPILAAGSPDSSPAGAMGSVIAPTMQVPPTIAQGVSAGAKDAMNMLLSANTSLAQADNLSAQASAARANAGLTTAKTVPAQTEAKISSWLNNLLDRIGNYSAKQYKTLQDAMSNYGRAGFGSPAAHIGVTADGAPLSLDIQGGGPYGN